MLLVPLFSAPEIACVVGQATRSHAIYKYSTPNVCINIHAVIHRCIALTTLHRIFRIQKSQVQSVNKRCLYVKKLPFLCCR